MSLQPERCKEPPGAGKGACVHLTWKLDFFRLLGSESQLNAEPRIHDCFILLSHFQSHVLKILQFVGHLKFPFQVGS